MYHIATITMLTCQSSLSFMNEQLLKSLYIFAESLETKANLTYQLIY